MRTYKVRISLAARVDKAAGPYAIVDRILPAQMNKG